MYKSFVKSNLYLFVGITALHRAADWGKIDVVKLLVENGADMQATTTYGERARESALRYRHIECVDYLDWAGMYIIIYYSIVFRLNQPSSSNNCDRV